MQMLPRLLTRLQYIWKTAAGSFLSWNSNTDFKVVDMGYEYTGSEDFVYLAPPIESEMPDEGNQVTVEIRKKDSHDLIGQATVFVDYSDDYFTIR